MEGFLVFLGVLAAIALLVIPIILLAMVSGLRSQIDMLNRRVMQLFQELKSNTKPVEEVTTPKPVEEVAMPPVTVDHRAYMPQEIAMEEVVNEPEPEIAPETHEAFVAKPIEEPAKADDIESVPESVPEPVVPKQPKSEFNFERFIGENLINKIGIGVLVIGIGLFVKYAIDNNWLNEVGRVVIGFLSGGILLALAFRFRNAYRAFSSVLTGGAMSVFYFTVAIAFREYDLFGQTASFLIMVAITAFSVWLSVLYNRRELAILSLIGGMLTPFMVSRGDGNYHVLFTYIAILDIGMLTLSLRKQWKELLVISFLGTQLIFWLYFIQGSSWQSTPDSVRDTAMLLYASVFYVIFLLMPLVQVFRNKETSKDHALHIIMLVANSFMYLLAAVLLFNCMDTGSYKGLLTALLAVVNGIVAALLYNNKKDKVLFYLFAGLTICFVTLAAPMQFEGNNITLFWATEAVLLLWLFRKSNTTIYYYSALLLLVFTFFNMMIDHNLQQVSYGFESHIRAEEGVIFLNRYFITRLYASLAFVAAGWLLRRYCSDNPVRTGALPGWLPTAVGTVAAILLFYAGNRELYLFTDTNNTLYWRMAYGQVFALALSIMVGRRAGICWFRFATVIALWALINLVYWATAYNIGNQRESLVYDHAFGALHIMLYWVGFAGLCGLCVVAARTFYGKYALKSAQGKTFTWFFNAAALISLSIALVEALNQITAFNSIYMSNKAAVTVLWSLCAFVQMWLGMRFKYKTLRIISLSLLGLVLCKLFMFDLSNVSQGGKIIAFVVLGIVLLVLSFLYQKLKKILFEDDDKKGEE